MTTYLTIITTVLVLTQIIRVIQNTIQLKGMAKLKSHNEELMEIWRRIDKATEFLVDDRIMAEQQRRRAE